jgi:hypothetical protein
MCIIVVESWGRFAKICLRPKSVQFLFDVIPLAGYHEISVARRHLQDRPKQINDLGRKQ